MTTPHGGTPDKFPADRDPAHDPLPTRADLRKGAARAHRPGPVRRLLTWVGVTALLLVVAILGYAVFEYVTLDKNLQRSDILSRIHPDDPTTQGLASDTNILLMGLDSRLDLKGDPLPQDLYDAMRTGDSSIGGMNANVLMALHIPSDGRQATVIQIPRDNFVDYAGCYGDRCDGKIKEAYDHAYEARKAETASQSGMSEEDKHKDARDAGRAAEILTVEKFLGNGIRFDHWVEVTMVAFYQIAQEVQPITVCLKHDTKDAFSGADFKAGKQEINAEQAMSFVRQRRDSLTDVGTFTDLDRERRQQAFIASLTYQLKQRGTFTNPARLNGLIGVATKNVAVDAHLNLLELAGQAKQLTDGKVTFYTLPVEGFVESDKHGQNSNTVDIPRIQATVAKLLDPAAHASASPTHLPSSGAKPTVSVINGSGVSGAAGSVLGGLVRAGYGRGGDPSTAAAPEAATMVEYASGQGGLAAELAVLLGGNVSTVESADVLPGSLRVTLGTGYQVPAALSGTTSPAPSSGPSGSPSTSATPLSPSTVGTGGAEEDTSASTLTAMAGGSVPCVK